MRTIVPPLLAALVFLLSSGAHPALAHALLEQASPAPGSVLPTPPPFVRLAFSEDLNGLASRIVVWDRYRHVENVGNAQVVSGHSRELQIPLRRLPAGSYLVLWTSVSADDGHVLRGSYSFSVGHAGPLPVLAGFGSGGQGAPDGQTLASIAAHWLELLAAVVWTGAEGFALLVLTRRLPDPGREVRRRLVLVRGSLLVLLLASVAVLLLLAYTLTGSTINSIFSGRYAQLWLVRQLIVLIALGLSFVVLEQRLEAASRGPGPSAGGGRAQGPVPTGLPPKVCARGTSTRWRVLSAVLAAVYLLIFAGSGHAASSRVGQVGSDPLFSVAVLMDWFHFVADALWFGGQIYLALVLLPIVQRGGEGVRSLLDTLARFSPVAYISVGLYSVSGVFTAKIHIPSWYAFFNSVYGRTLIIKILLIGLMVGVSVLTVYFLRPQLRRALDTEDSPSDHSAALLEELVFWLRINPVLGAGVLLATSVLFYYPVPFGFGPPGPAAYTATASGITATATLTPDRAGPNRLTVRLRDGNQRPVQLATVSVLTTMLDMPMGTGVAPLNETRPGIFSGPVDLGMGGHWRLLLLVYRPHPLLTRLSITVTVGQ